MRRALILTFWFLVGFALPFAVWAQSGTSQWATWSTVRSNGTAVTTFTPHPGIVGGASAPIIRPSDVGGLSKNYITSPGSAITWAKPKVVPYTSFFGGAAQSASVMVSRGATKSAVITAAATAARIAGSQYAGAIIIGASVVGALFEWSAEDGHLKTLLAPVSGGTEGSEYPASYVTETAEAKVAAQGGPFASHAEACQASGASWNGGYYDTLYCNTVVAGICQRAICGVTHMQTNGTWIYPSDGQAVGFVGPAIPVAPTRQILGCPNGGHRVGAVCVIDPDVPQCPNGYSQSAFTYGDWQCAPDDPVGKPRVAVPQELAEAAVGHGINTDADLGDLWDKLPEDAAVEGTPEPTVSGPSELPSSTSSTPTPTGRTDRTIQPNITYNDNSMTIGDTVTETYYDLSNNVVGTNTTVNAPGEGEEVIDPASVTDPAVPGVIDFYTPQFTEGFSGVWEARKAALISNPFGALIEALTPNWGDGGECPAVPFPGGNYFGLAVGTGSMAPPCFIWTVLRWMLIAFALFKARAIIFGG